MRKLRAHPGVGSLLERARPDLIVFHGLCGWELLTVARYAARFPNVKVFADSHEDHFNSGRNWLSRVVLHKQYYRRILHAALPVLQPILCISVDTMRFVQQVYGIPAQRLEFFPLGGRILEDDEYHRRRARTRAEFSIGAHETLFVQSGKMDAAKRLIESLRAFAEVPSPSARFLVAGALDASIKSEALAMIEKDPRVRFIGWLSSDRLRDLLCAADLYVQPGSQSATMQMSLCCRCPVILDDVASHEPFVQGCGWLVRDQDGLISAMKAAAADPTALRGMSEVAAGVAARMLDYRQLAARLTR
jgi:glycosyltransferase involved in cell wall biosynthesis